MMKSLEISIRTLTPIWTGGADRTTGRLHETGIIGSLRWWYEAIVRGLGGSACDPTRTMCSYKKQCLFIQGGDPRSNEERLQRYLKDNFEIGWAENSDMIDDGETICIYKDENSAKIVIDEVNKKATLELSDGRSRNLKIEMENCKLNIYDLGICDVCQVFGATGWKRRFDMRIVRDETRPAWTGTDLRIIPPGRSHGWFLPAGRVGKFTLKIRGDLEIVGMLASLLLFLEERGAIGAKPQLGYGFFKIANRSEVSKCAKKWENMGSNNERSDVPDLRHWFFFKFRFKPSRDDWWMRIGGLQRLLGNRKDAGVVSHLAEQGMVPVSPVLKNQWRFMEWNASRMAEQLLFGSSTGDKIRGKVSTSWAYREGDVWVVRGWAWLPEVPPQYRREIDALEKILGDQLIWAKVLNLDYTSPTGINVDRLTDKDIIRYMRDET